MLIGQFYSIIGGVRNCKGDLHSQLYVYLAYFLELLQIK